MDATPFTPAVAVLNIVAAVVCFVVANGEKRDMLWWLGVLNILAGALNIWRVVH